MNEKDAKLITCPNCGTEHIWVEEQDISRFNRYPQIRVGEAWLACKCRECSSEWTLQANDWKVVDLFVPST